MTPELQSVRVVAEEDAYPPLDHLGEYRSDPGPDDRTIDRKERGDHRPGQRRYFVAENAEYAEQDYERMEDYARGMLTSYGIRATATVRVAGTAQKLDSPGLWGVPSDADHDYAGRVASEQLHSLREILDGLGVDHADPLTGKWDDNAPWSGSVTE